MASPLDATTLTTLFSATAGHHAWSEERVSDDTLRHLFERVRCGPTAPACSPGRFVFVRSSAGKRRLAAAVSRSHLEKTLAAPVTVIVAWDKELQGKPPALVSREPGRVWFTGSATAAHESAFRNCSMQAAYLILAARSLGLDAGPLSGFDQGSVDMAFFAGTSWTANLLVNLGHGRGVHLHERVPRLRFDDACLLA